MLAREPDPGRRGTAGILPCVAPVRASARSLPADVVGFRAALLAWFERDGRALAFRAPRDPDPWSVLVSEVMAQQTQVGRVAERWRGFMDRYPTPVALAEAPTGDVIRAWRGVGYNRRAIDLQRAARAIVAAGGRVPADVASLEALPGVGPYTARAVAAIAFGRPVGAVDVNVRRVLGRLVGFGPGSAGRESGDSATGGPASGSPVGPPRPGEIQAAADALVDPARPADWTHALMDLGATVCRPAVPACTGCPVRSWCAYPAVTAHPAGSAAVRWTTPARRPALRFEATTRWLRGRIVDRLCSVPPGTSVRFDGPLGVHAPAAVSAALLALAADGLVELDGGGAARLAGERP
jgi:A/G-specific adenine glycosylase